MNKEKDLYIGEQTARTIACRQATYKFCLEKLQKLGIEQDSLGLDIGSNQGFGLRTAEAMGYEIISSDYEIKYAKLARQNLENTRVLTLDARGLPFKWNSFDFILMHQVIEHLPKGEQTNALAEIVRVIKPEKGVLFISTPNADSRPKWSRPYSPDHKYELGFDEFAQLLGNYFGSIEIYGQRFLKEGLVSTAYQLARASFLNEIYFNYLPKPIRLKFRDQLSKHHEADVVRPIEDGRVPRNLLAVCRSI